MNFKDLMERIRLIRYAPFITYNSSLYYYALPIHINGKCTIWINRGRKRSNRFAVKLQLLIDAVA